MINEVSNSTGAGMVYWQGSAVLVLEGGKGVIWEAWGGELGVDFKSKSENPHII